MYDIFELTTFLIDNKNNLFTVTYFKGQSITLFAIILFGVYLFNLKESQ